MLKNCEVHSGDCSKWLPSSLTCINQHLKTFVQLHSAFSSSFSEFSSQLPLGPSLLLVSPQNCKTLLTLSQSHTYVSFLHGIQGSSHFCTTTSQSASALLNRKSLTATSFSEPAAVKNKATFWMSSFLLAYKHRTKCLLNFLQLSWTFPESFGSDRDSKFSIPLLRLFLFLVPCGAQ